jgi:hypothetical protein
MPNSLHVCGSIYYLPLSAVDRVLKQAADASHPEAALDEESPYGDRYLTELYKKALKYRMANNL